MPPPPLELKVAATPETVRVPDPSGGVVVEFVPCIGAATEDVGMITPNPPVELNVAVSLETVIAPEPWIAELAVAVAPGPSTPDPAIALVNPAKKPVVMTKLPLVVTAGIPFV
jgi:hypothetical protein